MRWGAVGCGVVTDSPKVLAEPADWTTGAPPWRRYNRFSIAAGRWLPPRLQPALEPRTGLSLVPVQPFLPATFRPAWRLPPGSWVLLAGLLMGLLTTGLPAAANTPATAADIERQYRGGDTRQAVLQLEQALAQRPGDAPLRFLQAVLASEAGQTAQATRLLERMTEEFPDLPEPYNNLAVLQAAGGQLDRARNLLETALRLDPAYRTAHENLGDVFVRLAQRAYESAAGPRSEPLLQTKLRLARELATLR